MATCSSILPWETSWTEEPAGLRSMGMQRVVHDRVAEHTHTHKEHCVMISCMDILQHDTMIRTIRVVNTSLPHIIPFFFFLVRTLKMNSLSNF